MPNLKEVSSNLKQAVGLRIAAGVVGIALLALFAPLIWTAVTAGVGLLVLGAFLVIGIGLFQSLPLMAQKWENKILELRKAEARKRPIEQLQNYLLQKKQAVKNFRDAVKQIGTQIKGMADMIEERKRTKPDWDSSKKEKALAQMNGAHQVMVAKYQNAEKALDDLEDIIEEKKFDWKFGQAGADAINSLNAASGEDLVEKMLADEAFDSVRDNFNAVFSDLELEAVKLSSNKSLSYDDGMTIDLSEINLTNSVKVGA